MKNLIEHIINGKASDAASLVQKTLNKKLATAIIEHKSTVASEVYGSVPEGFVVDESEYDALFKAQSDKNAHEKANAAVNNWGAKAPATTTFADLQNQAADGMTEDENGNAAIQGRIQMLQTQIKTQGDPGGKRRQALKKLQAQLQRG